jgi:hypothetical protein
MPLDCVYQKLFFVDRLEEVGVAVGQHCMVPVPALDVLEHDMVPVVAKDEDPAVESLLALGEEGFVVFFESFNHFVRFASRLRDILPCLYLVTLLRQIAKTSTCLIGAKIDPLTNVAS